MNCIFQSLKKGTPCSRGCGRRLAMTFTRHPAANCKVDVETIAAPVGDAIEELLASHGITKEWWQDYKAKHGLPPTCGCDSRREYLNELSKAHPNLAKYGVMVFRALTRKPQ